MQRYDAPNLPLPPSPFRHVVADDCYVFLSGLVAADLPDGAALVGDPEAEAGAVMAAIRDLLAGFGLTPAALVRVDVYLTDLDAMPAFDAVYAGFFPAGVTPARTCVEVARLFGGCSVEVTATARRG